jgi:hypothetical protein
MMIVLVLFLFACASYSSDVCSVVPRPPPQLEPQRFFDSVTEFEAKYRSSMNESAVALLDIGALG